jgi:hypothetical protein
VISLGSKLAKPSDQSVDFFTAESMDLMFIRSSQGSRKIWNDHFISRVADSVMSPKSDFVASQKHVDFVHILTEAMGNNGGVKLGKLNEEIMVMELGPNMSNRSLSDGQSKMLFWPHNMASDSVQRHLRNVNLWLIDSDSSCSTVVCSQKQK